MECTFRIHISPCGKCRHLLSHLHQELLVGIQFQSRVFEHHRAQIIGADQIRVLSLFCPEIIPDHIRNKIMLLHIFKRLFRRPCSSAVVRCRIERLISDQIIDHISDIVAGLMITEHDDYRRFGDILFKVADQVGECLVRIFDKCQIALRCHNVPCLERRICQHDFLSEPVVCLLGRISGMVLHGDKEDKITLTLRL